MTAVVGLDDGLGLDDMFWLAAGIATVVGALRLMLGGIMARTTTFLAWQERFQRDWEGESEEPGRSRVPGVMERLNAIDGELKRNGGSTMKDQIVQTREVVDRLAAQVTLIERRQREIRELTIATADRLDGHLQQPRP